MQRPAADPAKLLDAWMEWERGDATPGRVMANLKTGGLRDLLERLASTAQPAEASIAGKPADETPGESDAGGWTPVV